MSATDELIDAMLDACTGIDAAAARNLLRILSAPEALPALLAHLVATAGTDPVVRALADAVEPGNLVAALVDEGVLVELERSGWDPDSRSPSTNMAGQGRPRGSLPLYRAAEPGEADRG